MVIPGTQPAPHDHAISCTNKSHSRLDCTEEHHQAPPELSKPYMTALLLHLPFFHRVSERFRSDIQEEATSAEAEGLLTNQGWGIADIHSTPGSLGTWGQAEHGGVNW